MLFAATVFAAATGSSGGGSIDIGNLIAPILSTGIVGVVLVMLIFEIGFITKRSAEREREGLAASHSAELKSKDQIISTLQQDVSELKESNKGLQELTRERMLPALVQATDVSRAYVNELARMNDRRGRDGS